MKTNLICLAAGLLLAACAPKSGNTTKVVGQFKETAPEVVEFVMGDVLDTTVIVKNGRFEVEIPKDLTRVAVFQPGDYMGVDFLSDGSVITIDPEKGTAVSSNKKGPQARYAAYVEWMESFISDYRAKIADFGEDEEAAAQYFDEIIDPFNDYQKETIAANSDNILGLMAFSQLMMDDVNELLGLLDGFSDEMKVTPAYVSMREVFTSPVDEEQE